MEKIKVLIVEDDPITANMITVALGHEAPHFQIETVSSAVSCLERLDTEVPHCIISDYQMPDMNGMELLRRLRHDGHDIPFIFLTAQGSEEVAREAFKNGAYDYFTKSVGFAHFPRIVNSIEQAVNHSKAELHRKMAEKELVHERNKLETILASVGDSISIQDRSYRVMYQNPAHIGLVGDHGGAICYEKYGMSDVVCPGCPVERCFSDGRVHKLEKSFERDGRTRYIEITSSPLRSPSGEIIAGIEVVRDITERKEAEVALRTLSRAVEQSPNMVTIASPECIVEYVNPKFCELTGYAPEEVVGEDASVLREQSETECSVLMNTIKAGTDWKGEFQLLRKDGGRFWVDASISSLKDPEGNITNYICIQEDITGRKQAQEETARLAAAVESIAEAVYVTDITGVILYVNPAFEEVTGYTKEEAVGRSLDLLNMEGREKGLFGDILAALSAGMAWRGVYGCTKKDGTAREIEGTISPVRSQSGEMFNYVAVMKDVTEKKRLESIAESVNSMNNLGYVFSSVRHEVGGPLNALKMTLGIINNNLDRYSRDTVRESIDRCLEEIGRVEYLMHSLKSFNMYERPVLSRVAMSAFMEKFLSLVQTEFAKRGIEVSYEADNKDAHVMIDPRALQQVMLNVMSNAADSLSGVDDPLVEIKVSVKDSMVVISVKDNGCGMTEEQKSNLFKPFYTSKQNGTGLGLVIAKRMLSKMDGTIDISSRRGGGTTVRLTIPEDGIETE